jgi:hypothetical protein
MSGADILRGTLFVQRNAKAGIWEEKYAVLASTYLAYYNSGTDFNRHRQNPNLKLLISSVKEVHSMSRMVTAKHALKIIWKTDTCTTKELLLGFQNETLRAKWNKSLEEQARAYKEETLTALHPQEPKDHGITAVTEPNDNSEANHCKEKEMFMYSSTDVSVDDELCDEYEDWDCYQSINSENFKPPRVRPAARPPWQATKLAAESPYVPMTATYGSRSHLPDNGGRKSLQLGEPRNERIKNAGQLKRNMLVYANYSYQASDADELSIDKGDTIQVIDEPAQDDWWCKGKNIRTLKEGLFPVNYVDTTNSTGSNSSLQLSNSEEGYRPLDNNTLTAAEEEDMYKLTEEADTEAKMEHEELGVDLRATQRKLREHIQALKTITEPKLYDIVENGGICKDPAKFLQLRLERDHLAACLERTQKRLDHALSERNQYQTKLQACENKFESVQCSLEKALQNNADLNNKLSELEQHKTIVGLRALERDDARTLLTQAERLNGELWDDIISLSEEMWRAKEDKERALQELRRKAEAATSTANEERQGKETIARELTVMKKRYSDKLSASETERRQLKERVDTLEEQLSELKAKLDDTCRQLAEAQKELAGNSDTERNLARQVGCLRVELDTLEVKYSTALDEKKIAEEKAMTAEQELSRVRRMVVSDDEDREQSTIDDLKKRIKDLEEVNKHLEELQVLREETSN